MSRDRKGMTDLKSNARRGVGEVEEERDDVEGREKSRMNKPNNSSQVFSCLSPSVPQPRLPKTALMCLLLL